MSLLKQTILIFAAGITCTSVLAQQKPQTRETQQPVYHINKPPVKTNTALDLETKHKDPGEFNYSFFRVGLPLTSGKFYNQMQNISQQQKELFNYKDQLKPSFSIGLDLGFVMHVARLGTPAVRLGVNTNFNFQYFGGKTEENADRKYEITTEDGTGLVSIGVGPQVTYKPAKQIRLGLYGRVGATAIGGKYRNEQTSAENDFKYRLNLKMLNVAFSQDIGLDVSYRKLLVGVSASFAKIAPRKTSLLSEEDQKDNYFRVTDLETGAESTSNFNPDLNFNRITIHLGLSL